MNSMTASVVLPLVFVAGCGCGQGESGNSVDNTRTVVTSVKELEQKGRPSRIHGQVLSDTGSSISGQEVYLSYARLLYFSRREISDANGMFAFDALPAGTATLAWGPLLQQHTRITVVSGSHNDVSCTLTSQGLINISGTATENARLMFYLLDVPADHAIWPPRPVVVRTAPDGGYNASLVPGDYVLSVWPLRSTPNEEAPGNETIAEGVRHENVGQYKLDKRYVRVIRIAPHVETLDLPTPKGVLAVKVLDPNGAPVSDLQLLVSPAEVQEGWLATGMSAWGVTDETGTCSFSCVAKGHYDIWAEPTGSGQAIAGPHLKKGIETDGKLTSVTMRLQKTVMIQIQCVWPELRDMSELGCMVVSDGEPKLRSIIPRSVIHGLPTDGKLNYKVRPGRYTVYAIPEQRNQSCAAVRLDTKSGGCPVLSIERAGALRVVLHGTEAMRAGKAVELRRGGKLVPRPYNPMWSYSRTLAPITVLPTDAGGVTTIWHLQPGEYEITVRGTSLTSRVTVIEGKLTEVVLNASIE